MRIKQNIVHESSLQTSKSRTVAAVLFIYQSSILKSCLHVSISVEVLVCLCFCFFDVMQIKRKAVLKS
jgi:hypothetical protein